MEDLLILGGEKTSALGFSLDKSCFFSSKLIIGANEFNSPEHVGTKHSAKGLRMIPPPIEEVDFGVLRIEQFEISSIDGTIPSFHALCTGLHKTNTGLAMLPKFFCSSFSDLPDSLKTLY